MEFDKEKIEKEAEIKLPKIRGNLIKGDEVIPLTNENVRIRVSKIGEE